MLSSTLVSVCQYITGQHAFYSSIKHAHYILRLISVCISVTSYSSCKIFVRYISNHKEQFAIQVHTLWILIKLDFGELWGMHGLLLCEVCFFFVYCVIKRRVDRVPTLSVKQEWNNCTVSSIHLSVRFDWRNFALALATLQSFLYNFRLDYVGSGTLSDVPQSSMILFINIGRS